MHIQTLLADLVRCNVRGLAMDIDETLADTNTHFFTYTYERHPIPGRSLDEVRREYKFAEDVPEWKSPEAHATLSELLHSDEFHADIPVFPDAPACVASFPASMPVVAYITARPEVLRPGTQEWLLRHRFPDAPVVMRQSEGMVVTSAVRNRWKMDVLHFLWPSIVGIVDDNIDLAHELQRTDYPGTLYLYGPRGEQFAGHPRVVVCPTWPSVTAAVRS